MKIVFVTLVCFMSALVTVLPVSNQALRVTTEESLSLSVLVRSRHEPHFDACVPVRVNEPFRIVWGSATVKEIVSGVVKAPVEGEYSAKLSISEGNGQCRTETEPKLKLDKPDEMSNLVSLAFNHIDTYKFVLSKKPCE